MKAGLPQKEPAILARWQAEDLYGQVRKSRAGREKFIAHDGPPYANGDIHIGHALNKTLKDMVVRTQTLLGKDAPYVPGWDCHGLPIEWKVEEQYRKKKLNKDEVPIKEFRAECRAYAQHWVGVQREQMKRLGTLADWDHPYLTMDYSAEATIVGELMKFAESGQVYRGAKPVMWSPVEKTALAEAEIEYEDIVSTQIDVAFEIVESPIPELVGAYAVIWTTTPWTIPVNRAIAYGEDIEYRSVKVRATSDRARYSRSLVAEHLSTPCSLGDRRRSRIVDDRRSSRSERDGMIRRIGQGLRPRRHHRPPPDAQARRVLRRAASAARPAIMSPPTPAPAWSTWRPTMAKRISTSARRPGSTRCSWSTMPASIATTGRGFPAAAASSTTSSTRPTGRSAPTCARLARCSRRARTSSTATRIQLAVEGQGHLPLHPAMVHRDGSAAAAILAGDARRAALGQ